MPSFAGIEKPLEKCRITRKECVQIAALGERTPLLEEERRDEGKQAHGFERDGPDDQLFRKEYRFMSIPAVAPQM